MATGWPISLWTAFHTTPMEPFPMGVTRSYGPIDKLLMATANSVFGKYVYIGIHLHT